MFTHSLARRLLVLPALALAGTVLAACGGSPSASPGVASLGGGSATRSAPPSGTGNAFNQAIQFSKCMRSHGVTDFPDPKASSDGNGGAIQLKVNGGNGVNPDSATFKAAQQACQSLMPTGGPDGSGAKFDPTKIADWTKCIRAHGEPGFPDPTNTGTGLKIDLSGTGIDPNTMQKALEACKDKNPGGSIMVMAGKGKG